MRITNSRKIKNGVEGTPSIKSYELRQAWKGATVIIFLCVGLYSRRHFIYNKIISNE